MQSRFLTQCLLRVALSSAWTHLVIITWDKCNWHLAVGGQKAATYPTMHRTAHSKRLPRQGGSEAPACPPTIALAPHLRPSLAAVAEADALPSHSSAPVIPQPHD